MSKGQGKRQLPLPPLVSGGQPVLGHAVEFQTKRNELLQRGYDEQGSVFRLKLGPKDMVVLVGPEYAKIFFDHTDKELNFEKANTFLKPIIGEVALTAGHDVYLAQRHMVYDPFKRRKMFRHIDIMQDVIQRWLDSLGEHGELELTSAMGKLTQNVAGYTMFGDDFQAQMGDEFWEQFEIMGKSIDHILPPHLPLPKFIKRDIARKKILTRLKPIIKERRQHPENYNDFLQEFVNQKTLEGEDLDDITILNFIIGFSLAGHETTAGQAAWSIIDLIRNPVFAEKLIEETNKEVPYGVRFDMQKLLKLKYVRWCIDETTRLHPSAFMVLRYTDEDFDIGGYTIPADWMVVLGTVVAQRLPELYSNPQKYDPLRFSPERSEGKHRYANTAFGGGVHRCAGMDFANFEMMMLCSMLFQQFDLELITKDTKVQYGLGSDRPTPTTIRYKRKPIERIIPTETIQEAVAAGCPHISQQVKASKS